MPIPPDAAQRVRDEKRDIDEKIENLNEFIEAAAYNGLAPRERTLIHQQRSVMLAYSNILAARIERF